MAKPSISDDPWHTSRCATVWNKNAHCNCGADPLAKTTADTRAKIAAAFAGSKPVKAKLKDGGPQ